MNVGIEIRFNDGTIDWIDPVDEDDFELMEAEATDEYVIDNGFNKYSYHVKDVRDMRTYPLCPECGFDARYERHSVHCKLNKDYSDD